MKPSYFPGFINPQVFPLKRWERGIRYDPSFHPFSIAQGQRDAEDLRFQGINEVPTGRATFYVQKTVVFWKKIQGLIPLKKILQDLKFLIWFNGLVGSNILGKCGT